MRCGVGVVVEVEGGLLVKALPEEMTVALVKTVCSEGTGWEKHLASGAGLWRHKVLPIFCRMRA